MIKTLQSLRFIFCFTVLVAHFNYAGIEGHTAGVSVIFFTLLSGFLLSKAYGHKLASKEMSIRQFLKRRLIKLYPIHFLGFLLMMILFQSHFAQEFISWKTVANLLLIQGWIPSAEYYYSFNAPSWYFSAALFFMLMFPFLYKRILHMRQTSVLLTTVTILLGYIAYLLLLNADDMMYWLYIFPPVRLIEFVFGMLIWRMCQLSPSFGVLPHKTLTELFLFLAMVCFIILFPVNEKFYQAYIHWVTIIPLFIVFYRNDSNGGLISAFLQSSPMVWLSKLTMEIYILHYPIYQILFNIFRRKLNFHPSFGVMMVITFTITITAAYLVKRFFDKPVTSWLAKHI